MGLGGIPQPKPARGTFKREHRQRQTSVESREKRLKAESKRLDGHRCRFPRCPESADLESAHLNSHKGIGGDPKGLRTRLETLLTLCRRHHAMLDGREMPRLRVEPYGLLGARTECQFWIEKRWGGESFWFLAGVSFPTVYPSC